MGKRVNKHVGKHIGFFLGWKVQNDCLLCLFHIDPCINNFALDDATDSELAQLT